jgi:hypothetical protein
MKLGENNEYTFTYTPSFDKDNNNLWIGVTVNLDGHEPLYNNVIVDYKYTTPTPPPTQTTPTTPTTTTTKPATTKP